MSILLQYIHSALATRFTYKFVWAFTISQRSTKKVTMNRKELNTYSPGNVISSAHSRHRPASTNTVTRMLKFPPITVMMKRYTAITEPCIRTGTTSTTTAMVTPIHISPKMKAGSSEMKHHGNGRNRAPAANGAASICNNNNLSSHICVLAMD